MTRTQKKTPKRRPATGSSSRSRVRQRSSAAAKARPVETPDPPAPAPLTIPVAAIAPPDIETPLTTPEPAFAARMPEPETVRPFPSSRRAIFFDVENSSRPEHISRVIEHLAMDRQGRRTDFVAVGNWRVIGTDTARLLARHGAQLVHSAPAIGVRDWSDLRIAVASGVWLASGRPGDILEIVSDDRAFDAVGDVSASLGITFRRLSYRGLVGMPAVEAPRREIETDAASRRRRRGSGRYHGRPSAHGSRPAPSTTPVVALPTPSTSGNGSEPPVETPVEGGQTAPHDEIVAVVRDLARSGRPTTLDSLANALKARGFSRPPGSPRLITRLRRIREITVNRAGVISLVGDAIVERRELRGPDEPLGVVEPTPVREEAPAPSFSGDEPEEYEAQPVVEPAVAMGRPASTDLDDLEEDEGPGPGNERNPPPRPNSTPGPGGQGPGGRRWRSRRGGRRRHPRRPDGMTASASY